ncbi:MAG TPA: DUF3429 domain-containing protein [Alphaproteobacteria bacterium]|nr:DUF3429 domain-containing protein [Alphaproteobacteria bacterium]
MSATSNWLESWIKFQARKSTFNNTRTAPWGTLVVGFVGLFAFFTFALAMAFGSPTLAITAYLQLMHFGALVLSFIGAVHWGLAIGANARGITVPSWWYLASTLPMALGWLTLALARPTTKILLLSLGFFATFMLDVSATTRGHAPSWYKNFRKIMTIAVLVALTVALWAVRLSSIGNVPS